MKGRRRSRPRRQAVRKSAAARQCGGQRRRTATWVLAGLFVSLTTGGGWWWWQGAGGGVRGPLEGGSAAWWSRLRQALEFPFRQVQVVGQLRHVDAAQVRDIAAPYAERGFFATDVDAIRSAVRALPWVERAAVRRIWPDQLQITVVEQVAVARWGEEGLLNARGEVFVPVRGPLPEDLPRLAGPPGTAATVLAHYRDMAARLAALDLRLVALSQDRRRSWRARLDNGVELMLGKVQPRERVARFVRYYPQVVREEGDVRLFDLRYANGFAIRRAETRADGPVLDGPVPDGPVLDGPVRPGRAARDARGVMATAPQSLSG